MYILHVTRKGHRIQSNRIVEFYSLISRKQIFTKSKQRFNKIAAPHTGNVLSQTNCNFIENNHIKCTSWEHL